MSIKKNKKKINVIFFDILIQKYTVITLQGHAIVFLLWKLEKLFKILRCQGQSDKIMRLNKLILKYMEKINTNKKLVN